MAQSRCARVNSVASEALTRPEALLEAIVAALDRSACAYALVQPDRGLDELLASDIDIVFDRPPNEVMLPILRRLSDTTGARVVQCLHYEVPFGYYYVLAVGMPPRFLHLDCLFDPHGIHRYRLPTPLLLDGRVRGRHAARASDRRLGLYLLIKRAVKGHASCAALVDLRACFRQGGEALASDVRAWFGAEGAALAEALLRCAAEGDAARVLQRLRSLVDARFKQRHPARYIESLVRTAARNARRFAQPTGFFVVLLGPDGAGKSTVAGLVASGLARAFRRTWRFHWRPGLLPRLRRAKATDAVEPELSAPPSGSRYSRTVSLLRFGYYWLDFVVGYWLCVYPRKARTTLIVGERYFPDVVVNPQRYGFALPAWLLRVGARFVPAPDLIVLLTGEPEAIHRRKPELSVSAVAAQLVSYNRELAHWEPALQIDTVGDAEAVAVRIGDVVLDACARRTGARLGSRGRPPWRAYPTAARARLWVADDETLASAANLYQPGSTLARMLKASLRLIPSRISAALPGPRPDAGTAERLASLADCIREMFNRDDVSVSFAARASDPRRRLHAQVSIANRPLAYAKIATGAADAAKLLQEGAMIAWMRERLASVELPAVVGIESVSEYRLLLVTAPASLGKSRLLAPDELDVAFLSVLADLSEEKRSVEQVLQTLGIRPFLERLSQREPRSGEAVRSAVEAVRNGFAARPVRTAPAHGDYAPWNTLQLADDVLYVFDWEHATKDAPLFTDLFHRVAAPARLVLRHTPHRVIDRVASLPDDPLLGALVARKGVQARDLGLYALLYLLGLAVREEAEYGSMSQFVVEALERALSTVDRGGRRNVLVAAYACEPGGGSEPGVGWNVCQAISREHTAWVITRRNNREAIEAALARTPNPNLHFHYTDLPKWARFWKRGARGIRTYYYLWQFAAALEASRLIRRVRFDVAHHVTFVNSYVFSFLALLPLPFVWGPLGSNPLLPAALAPTRRALLRDRLRYAWQELLRVADPLFWLCACRARVILGINPGIGRHVPFAMVAQSKFVVHSAIGVEGRSVDQRTPCATGAPIRIVSMGQLIPIKGFHLALRAFAELRRMDATAMLEIVGDGPEKSALQSLAAKLGVADNVHFTGWLSRGDALARLACADIFLFPSCEGGGMVVLEAMAYGVPTVCLDYGGPGEMIGGDCGIAVRIGGLDATVSALAAALATLVKDSSFRQRMAQAATKRIAERYSWELRHEFIGRWYQAALSKSPRTREVRST